MISPWAFETESLARDCITEAAAVDHGRSGVRPGHTLMNGFDTLSSKSAGQLPFAAFCQCGGELGWRRQ